MSWSEKGDGGKDEKGDCGDEQPGKLRNGKGCDHG
jgi:hypothetical protein